MALLSPERRLRECHLSQMHSKKSEQSLPMHVRLSADHALRLCVACLPSNQEQGSTLRALSKPSPQTFKTQVFKLLRLKELIKISRSRFPSQWFSTSALLVCIPMCSTLTFLCDQGSLLSAAPAICFFHKPHLHTSYLPQCGLFSPSSCAVRSVSPQVNFLGIQNDLFEG